MFKLMEALKKVFIRDMNPKMPALLYELEKADQYIEFMREAMKRGYTIELAVIVDSQVCQSTTMLNKDRKTGRLVLEFLQEAAIGERMRIWAELQDLGSVPGKGL